MLATQTGAAGPSDLSQLRHVTRNSPISELSTLSNLDLDRSLCKPRENCREMFSEVPWTDFGLFLGSHWKHAIFCVRFTESLSEDDIGTLSKFQTLLVLEKLMMFTEL